MVKAGESRLYTFLESIASTPHPRHVGWGGSQQVLLIQHPLQSRPLQSDPVAVPRSPNHCTCVIPCRRSISLTDIILLVTQSQSSAVTPKSTELSPSTKPTTRPQPPSPTRSTATTRTLSVACTSTNSGITPTAVHLPARTVCQPTHPQAPSQALIPLLLQPRED